MRLRRRAVQEQIEQLNDAERQWVVDNVAEATRLVDGELTPEALDGLWTDCCATTPPTRTPGST